MTIRSRLARLEAKLGAPQGRCIIVVPIAHGESYTDALSAAGVIPEPSDLVVLVTKYGGGHFERTLAISHLPIGK
jgi:hypothetical protein